MVMRFLFNFKLLLLYKSFFKLFLTSSINLVKLNLPGFIPERQNIIKNGKTD